MDLGDGASKLQRPTAASLCHRHHGRRRVRSLATRGDPCAHRSAPKRVFSGAGGLGQLARPGRDERRELPGNRMRRQRCADCGELRVVRDAAVVGRDGPRHTCQLDIRLARGRVTWCPPCQPGCSKEGGQRQKPGRGSEAVCPVDQPPLPITPSRPCLHASSLVFTTRSLDAHLRLLRFAQSRPRTDMPVGSSARPSLRPARGRIGDECVLDKVGSLEDIPR